VRVSVIFEGVKVGRVGVCEGGTGLVVVAHGLSSCDFWAVEHRLNSCGAWA